jgi:hypothetical protein
MTTKKPRNVDPHTINVAVSGLGEFPELDKVLDTYFDTGARSNASERILQAVNAYHTDWQINPKRQPAEERREDWRQLIESMKELNQRLNPIHIPRPMLDAARIAYRPATFTKNMGGKPTLNDELGELLLRLRHLVKLFEAIPEPRWTNPGKLERDTLVQELEKIFDAFPLRWPPASHRLQRESKPKSRPLHRDRKTKTVVQDVRKHFVRAVFNVFHLPPPPL